MRKRLLTQMPDQSIATHFGRAPGLILKRSFRDTATSFVGVKASLFRDTLPWTMKVLSDRFAEASSHTYHTRGFIQQQQRVRTVSDKFAHETRTNIRVGSKSTTARLKDARSSTALLTTSEPATSLFVAQSAETGGFFATGARGTAGAETSSAAGGANANC